MHAGVTGRLKYGNCGKLCCGNCKGGDDENTQVRSTNDVASDGVTGWSMSFVVCAIRISCIYLSAILRVKSKVQEWVHLTWVHVSCNLKGCGP